MKKNHKEKSLKSSPQLETSKAQQHQLFEFFTPTGGGSWVVRASSRFFAGFLVTLLIVTTYIISGSKISSWSNIDQLKVAKCCSSSSNNNNNNNSISYTHKNFYSPLSSSSFSSPSCDYFLGKWVYDNQSHPLYKQSQCSFMSDYLACKKNGRTDLRYQSWRWQPQQCDLPRFNAKALLEKLRNKRLVYVGDSINRGQWESMVCLVETAISSSSLKSMSYTLNYTFSVFKAIEYNATIEFYWSPYLVESNADDPFVHHGSDEQLVRVEAIEKHASHWTDADVLVFDSYSWWRLPTLKVVWGSFEHAKGVTKEMEMLTSYEMMLKTWSDWLEGHVNRSKTQLFWVSMSPTHHWGGEWGGGSNCYNETEPITEQGYWGRDSSPEMMRTVQRAIHRLGLLGLKVQILNITQLSQYRKEAHLSVHRRPWGALNNKTQVEYPISSADCSHWCLPGVPDTWNHLLYAFI